MATESIIKDIYTYSYKKGVGHIGSCITAAPILNAIYTVKGKNDIVILSAGHAGLALFVTLKAHGYNIDPDTLGTHPDYNPTAGIDASTGSLGHGIGIAVGYALADRSRYVYCVCTDGEIAEGSFWEALDVAARQKLSNLKIFINCNGYSAYQEVDIQRVVAKVVGFGIAALCIDGDDTQLIEATGEWVRDYPLAVVVKTNSDFLDVTGLDAHYKPLTKEQYEKAIR